MNSSQGSWLGKRHSWQVNGLFRLLRTGLDKAPFVSLNKLNILLRIFIAIFWKRHIFVSNARNQRSKEFECLCKGQIWVLSTNGVLECARGNPFLRNRRNKQLKFGLDESNKISFCNISMKIAWQQARCFSYLLILHIRWIIRRLFTIYSLQFLFLLIIKIHFNE